MVVHTTRMTAIATATPPTTLDSGQKSLSTKHSSLLVATLTRNREFLVDHQVGTSGRASIDSPSRSSISLMLV